MKILDKINLVLWKANNKWWKTHSENQEGYIRYLAERVYDYFKKKGEDMEEVKGLKLKYFVLNPNKRNCHGKASRLAIKIYAKEIRPENPVFAHDLDEWISGIEKDIIKKTEYTN